MTKLYASPGEAKSSRALLLLPEAPYPIRGGGPLRSACMVDYLARHFELSAVTFRVPGQDDPALRFPAGTLARSVALELPTHSKRFAARAVRNLGRALRGVPPLVDRFAGQEAGIGEFLGGRSYDLIWLEHFWLAPYAGLLRGQGRKLVLNLHNIESQLFASLVEGESPWLRPLLKHFARRYRALERELLTQFDLVLTPSEEDSRRARDLGAKRVETVANTLPWYDLPLGNKSYSIVFSGNFEYQPNQQALRWFLRECWPLILTSLPDLRLRLVGIGSEFAARHSAGAPNVDLVGTVEDAIEEIALSLVAVVPLLAGSGTRLKILEAWAAGTAVVSTPIGAEGLAAVPGRDLEIAAQPNTFAQSVIALVQNEEERSRLATQARKTYVRDYTWSSAQQRLIDIGL